MFAFQLDGDLLRRKVQVNVSSNGGKSWSKRTLALFTNGMLAIYKSASVRRRFVYSRIMAEYRLNFGAVSGQVAVVGCVFGGLPRGSRKHPTEERPRLLAAWRGTSPPHSR